MKRSTSAVRAVGALGLLALALTGCGGDADPGSGGSADPAGSTYTWWDPYPQHEEGSDWANRVQACGDEAGVTIERTAYDTTALTNQALLSAQEGTSPDIILIDNPAVSTLADTGMLATTEELGLSTDGIDENLLAAGQVDGDTYGVPIGANTLALYYNKAILDAAGVDPASITDWASLTDALAKVSATGNTGISFSAIGTEEGSFQFLPWFWGAGADLTQLDSPQAQAAVDLWKGWVDQGYAPQSVLTNSQNTVWEEFLTGTFAFAENGTWQVNSAADAGFETGIIQIPAEDGGTAPAPTGGEFITAPVQDDTSRYAATTKIIDCMTTPEGLVDTATTFAYYIPPTDEGQQQLLAEDPSLQVWVDAVEDAKGRTSDDLGTAYPLISEQLWTAVQNSLSGASTPQDALATAQTEAEAATS